MPLRDRWSHATSTGSERAGRAPKERRGRLRRTEQLRHTCKRKRDMAVHGCRNARRGRREQEHGASGLDPLARRTGSGTLSEWAGETHHGGAVAVQHVELLQPRRVCSRVNCHHQVQRTVPSKLLEGNGNRSAARLAYVHVADARRIGNPREMRDTDVGMSRSRRHEPQLWRYERHEQRGVREIREVGDNSCESRHRLP